MSINISDSSYSDWGKIKISTDKKDNKSVKTSQSSTAVSKETLKKADKNNDGSVMEEEFLENVSKDDRAAAKKLWKEYLDAFDNEKPKASSQNTEESANTENKSGNSVFYKYDKNGKIQYTVTLDGKTGKQISNTVYKYDESGQLAYTVDIDSKTGKQTGTTVYKYGENDKLAYTVSTDNESGQQTVSVFDENGALKSTTVKDKNGNVISPDSNSSQNAQNTISEKNLDPAFSAWLEKVKAKFNLSDSAADEIIKNLGSSAWSGCSADYLAEDSLKEIEKVLSGEGKLNLGKLSSTSEEYVNTLNTLISSKYPNFGWVETEKGVYQLQKTIPDQQLMTETETSFDNWIVQAKEVFNLSNSDVAKIVETIGGRGDSVGPDIKNTYSYADKNITITGNYDNMSKIASAFYSAEDIINSIKKAESEGRELDMGSMSKTTPEYVDTLNMLIATKYPNYSWTETGDGVYSLKKNDSSPQTAVSSGNEQQKDSPVTFDQWLDIAKEVFDEGVSEIYESLPKGESGDITNSTANVGLGGIHCENMSQSEFISAYNQARADINNIKKNIPDNISTMKADSSYIDLLNALIALKYPDYAWMETENGEYQLQQKS